MREIKFRLWSESEKQFFFWDAMEKGPVWLNYKNTDSKTQIQQYTGLKDKNGVEIYEGDILRVTYERDDIVEKSYTGEVEFGDCCLSYTSEAPQHGSMGFYLKTENQDEPQIGLFQDHNLIDGAAYNEVVGNIFEGVDK